MKSADRVLGVLEAVVLADRPIGVMSIARATGLDKSTAHRIASALAEQGWLERDGGTAVLSAGARTMYLAHHLRVRNSFYAMSSQLLEGVRDLTGETVTLQRRTGLSRICVVGFEGTHDIRRAVPGVEPIPLHQGPSGKVILAHLPESTWGDGVGDDQHLRQQLAEARARGFLSTDGDRTDGVGALSVPVFAKDGIFGSLTVAGPSARWNSRRRKEFCAAVIEAAARISVGLLGAPSNMYDAWLAGLEPAPAGDRGLGESGSAAMIDRYETVVDR